MMVTEAFAGPFEGPSAATSTRGRSRKRSTSAVVEQLLRHLLGAESRQVVPDAGSDLFEGLLAHLVDPLLIELSDLLVRDLPHGRDLGVDEFLLGQVSPGGLGAEDPLHDHPVERLGAQIVDLGGVAAGRLAREEVVLDPGIQLGHGDGLVAEARDDGVLLGGRRLRSRAPRLRRLTAQGEHEDARQRRQDAREHGISYQRTHRWVVAAARRRSRRPVVRIEL